MDKVWVVEGATGEYSDHYEWPVCFHETEVEAKAMVEILTEKMGEAKVLFPDNRPNPYDDSRRNYMKAFDPHFAEDYTGTNYSCYEVPRGPAIRRARAGKQERL